MDKNFLIIVASSLLILIFSVFFRVTAQYASNSQVPNTSFLGCTYSDLSGSIDYSDNLAVFEAGNIPIPWFAYENAQINVLGVSAEERWVEVDLSDQKLYAWEGDSLYLETPISSGLPWWPTPTGEFRIWIKLRATRMEGGSGKYYYNLPNVPYVMYFENSSTPGWRGYGLHGTYWHNDFGRPRSHGCVNLPTSIAKEIYYWAQPNLEEGKSSVKSSQGNPGTRVVIHE